MTEEVATVAATGMWSSDTREQQKSLVFRDLMNMKPLALKGENKNRYLLGDNSTIKELYDEQPSVSFITPPLPSAITGTPSTEYQNLLQHLISNSNISNVLKDEAYVEIDEKITESSNIDWTDMPQSRYSVSQLFAGCILLDGTKALLVNCIESYGRKLDVDPRAGQYATNDEDTSIPSNNDIYSNVYVRLFDRDNSVKLVIGTLSCNLLVTSSCTIEKIL